MSRWLMAVATLFVSSMLAAATPPAWQATVDIQPLGMAKLPDVVVPKQSVILKVTVWMPEKVNWYPRYPQWDMPGAVLLPLLMLSPTIEREQAGSPQRGATQNYLLTPLAEGTLRLAPTQITVYPDLADSPVLPFAPMQLQVALPNAAGSIEQFLPATALKATQQFYLQTGENEPQEVAPGNLDQLMLQNGQVLERRITLEAQGIQGNQIPPLPVDGDSLQHQAQALDLNNYGDFTGGRRIEHWFYAPGEQNRIQLRPLAVRWYDLGSGTFKTEHLAGSTIHAVAHEQVDSRLRLSWWERLTLLSSRQMVVLLAICVLLVAIIRYRRFILFALQHGMNSGRRWVRETEGFQFLKLCGYIGVCGLGNGGAQHALQHWLQGRVVGEHLESCQAIQRLNRSRYGVQISKMPSRLDVLGELLVLRRRLVTVGRTPLRSRYDLPGLER
ncbi:hypothetical protein ACQKP5_23440 [Pseudomonas vancouverensis]|uniref:hypothetical protein n=1 Tax=Pseudomonas vancouverensis TaxID=95300 RepID=UPI003D049F11